VILDEEAAELLNRQTGNLGKSSGGGMKDLKSGKLFMGDTHPNITDSTGFGDSGGASRFFYTAKASKKERNAGLDDGEKNPHPTVKPLALMEYLCKLTRTPTGGIVIDPFMGSGTTGMACVNTGRDFIGIELIEEHYIIARKRIEHAKAILKKD
jgi:site-specific DNA-methyltransferase (adenine-specific)